ncbi:protein Wnt-7b-like [Ostrinia furnacalis]|uniref:protein Wnt-7b-like n=1 Tax=Ostrinia furnacalis TaxID=93504 RepID=UPI00103BD704|nr:protein Wnt-7b-like [Ostrinia furnacalis]
MAYAECRAQLAGRRWNCSGVGDDPRLGHVLPLATREAAFTYAITAAGVTHALSESCARGDLPACACAANRRRFSGAAEQFEYGGCGEASFSARFARRFLDARELEADARAAMNLHNNRVGRKRSNVVIVAATREAAFTYAITAAGVTHALSEACARGDLPACACAANRRRFSGAAEQFEYGGCGEASFGARFARRFLDARELEADARAAMNLHNNRVGRKVVKEMVRRECKCHGVSGSCAVRTCWRALPPFAAVGAALRDKLRRAKHVVAEEYDLRGLHARAVALRHPRLVVRRTGKPPRKSELVFLAKSPQYCEPDAAAAAPGTHGRHCNRTSKGEDGCDLLCCGRGYSTVTLVREAKCRCQFHWCCSVSCDSCVTRTDTHVCN